MKSIIFGKYNSLYWSIFSVDYLYKLTLKSANQILTYSVHIKYNESSEKILLSLEARDFLINGEAPNLMVDQLIAQCGKVLYPLQLSLSREGEFNKIYNYSELKQRWNGLKEKLYDYYKDAYSQNYLKHTDKVYSSEHLLSSKLKNTAFFFLYFGGIYNRSCGDELYREYTAKFKGIDFNFSQQLDNQTDEQGCFNLYREASHEDRKEKLSLRYLLHNEDKSIEEAVFFYLKNNKILQELKIERLPISEVTAFVEQEKKSSSKTSFSFWIDEKPSNLN